MLLCCSGLDHARRGYESFARECFDALRAVEDLELDLAKGSGPSGEREHHALTTRRDRAAAQLIGRARGLPAFRIEAAAFALGVQPLLIRMRPDVIYLSEWDTARVLAQLRRMNGLGYRILFCNGGFAETGFEHLDLVQELSPASREHVIGRGADPDRHVVLPLGFALERGFANTSSEERTRLREQLQLPTDRRLLISVAALNSSHKRLDYLIGELASVPGPRPFLLMVGEPDGETEAVRELARQRLGDEGFAMRTVPRPQVSRLLRASDVFALASTVEAQGRALIEAMDCGLPCIAHDSPVMRFAVGEHGCLADLTSPGALARLLQRDLRTDPAAAEARHRFVHERFSWDALAPRYVQLLRRAAAPGVAHRH